jgi:hypothetical protein
MGRRIGRWAGWILIALAVAALLMDAYEAHVSGSFAPMAAGELWYRLHRSSLGLLQAVVQRYISPWLWDPAIVTILTWPAFLVLGVPGVLLAVLCRKRRGSRRLRRLG